MAVLNRTQARQAIKDRVEFKGSNIYGYDGTGSFGTGRLHNEEDLNRFHNDKFTYVVYSYNTPIGWYCEDTGWYNVRQKFSVTTSKQAGLIPMDGTL